MELRLFQAIDKKTHGEKKHTIILYNIHLKEYNKKVREERARATRKGSKKTVNGGNNRKHTKPGSQSIMAAQEMDDG